MGKKIKGETEMDDEKSRKKIMDEVAKYLRFKVPTKSAVIKGEKIEYFQGSKAIDCLMDSKWTREPKSSNSNQPHFINRSYALDFCQKLLRKEYFIRVGKVEIKQKEDSSDLLAVGSGEKDTTVRKRGDKQTDSPRAKKQGDAEKRKRKFRLEYHRQQMFFDEKEDLYCWKYDPASYTTYIIGFSVVIGAIALTLQPLWPDSSRDAVWYVSVVIFILMGFLVVLIVVRLLVHGLVLLLTGGNTKFWILPNLDNEKSGFFDSFKPLYSLEFVSKKKSKKKSSSANETVKPSDETQTQSQDTNVLETSS